jgi:hypothetical protein
MMVSCAVLPTSRKSASIRFVASFVVSVVVLSLVSVDRAEALCDRITGIGSGSSEGIASANAREILKRNSDHYIKPTNGACQPLSIRCGLKDNKWKCTARRTCCEAGTPETPKAQGKVCKTLALTGKRTGSLSEAVGSLADRYLERRKQIRPQLGIIGIAQSAYCRTTVSRKCGSSLGSSSSSGLSIKHQCSQSWKCCNRR